MRPHPNRRERGILARVNSENIPHFINLHYKHLCNVYFVCAAQFGSLFQKPVSHSFIIIRTTQTTHPSTIRNCTPSCGVLDRAPQPIPVNLEFRRSHRDACPFQERLIIPVQSLGRKFNLGRAGDPIRQPGMIGERSAWGTANQHFQC
jgi:hypothetical protein